MAYFCILFYSSFLCNMLVELDIVTCIVIKKKDHETALVKYQRSIVTFLCLWFIKYTYWIFYNRTLK